MNPERLTVLVIGGYGTFGGRLVRLLADEPRLTLVVAGRSRAAAFRFCQGLAARARLVPQAFDRDGDLAAQLAAIRPDVVVDATGPFQAYAGDPYRVVRACLAQAIPYLDLADGSDFVRGIAAFDAEARARSVFVLSGASTFPALSGAVVRDLTAGLASVTSIVGGIAPSPYAGVGLNVIRAIAGYAGRPVARWRDGRIGTGHALTETMRRTIAPPGRLPLRNRLFSLVDVPDLTLLPAALPGLDVVWIGAGPVPELLHRALIGLAWLVRWRILPSLSRLAPLFFRAANVLRWGEHRGGMFVEVRGTDAGGQGVARSWHMLAEGDDGPLIPAMALEALVRKLLAGLSPPPGARAALGALDLADYDALFARRAILTGRREEGPDEAGLPLYRRLLGDAWDRLPATVRALHDGEGETRAAGRAIVDRGQGPLARAVAAVVGFPEAGRDVPVTVRFERRDGAETWHRTFGAKHFLSRQSEGRGRSERLVIERFGPFAFGLALVVEDARLSLVVRRWSLLGVPLPLGAAPVSRSFEAEVEGRFTFHVEIAHPWIGLIVRYRGWLEPVAAG